LRLLGGMKRLLGGFTRPGGRLVGRQEDVLRIQLHGFTVT
jgi:hypothetical protein